MPIARLATVFASLTLLPLGSAFAAAPAAHPLDRDVDAIVHRVLKKTGVPSASVAVVQDGKLAYAHAYGEARLQPRTAAEASMRYSIGSISKQFTASAILMLQEQGKLKLDDPLSKYLPTLAHGDEITIREVLAQVSGYPDYWPQDYVPPPMLKPIAHDALLADWTKTLDFKPGERWEYSNTNYVIAGMVVEKVSGQPLWDFLQAHIFGPLGMKSVANVNVAALPKTDSAGYRRFALGPARPAPKEGQGWLFAMGELAMTAQDLAKWDVSVMDRSLMKPTSYDQLERPFLLPDGEATHYGLGITVARVDEHKELRHDGEVSGYTALNEVFPDDRVAIVVLSNEDAADPALEQIANQIRKALFHSNTDERTALAKKIYQGLQKGRIDRSLFTADANGYFSKEALADFKRSLGPLGKPTSFEQTAKKNRGGMIYRGFTIEYPKQTLKIISYEQPDGKIEQFMIIPG